MKTPIVSSFQPWRGTTAATGIALLLVVFTAALGVWQWNRAYEKEALLSEARQKAEGLPALRLGLDPVFTKDLAPIDLNQRKVVLAGRWMPETTFYLDNRLSEGRAGLQVVTAMALADGSIAWVNRGWAEKPPGLSGPDTLAYVRGERHLPAGDRPAQIEAIALIDLMRRMELGRQPEDLRQGALWQNLDWKALRVRLGESQAAARVWPAIFWQTSSTLDQQDGLLRSLPQVSADDVSKHQGYALQWWLMSLVALVFAWRLRARPSSTQETDQHAD